ncbi:MAG: DoxX family membrane protein [Bacteroidetes bacterium]|nr:MAG: DoxX family membrane protein [Bacteroidota bacterium]
MSQLPTYSKAQLNVLVLLRMLIGWHLLYEGISKLWNPGWSSAGYLMDSNWLLGGIFQAMAGSSALVAVADAITIWGLILIGLALMLGIFTRYAAIGGMLLVGLFYLSHPPLIGTHYAMPAEGSSLLVNKNLIEVAALAVVLVFPTSHLIGLEGLLAKMRAQPAAQLAVEERETELEQAS